MAGSGMSKVMGKVTWDVVVISFHHHALPMPETSAVPTRTTSDTINSLAALLRCYVNKSTSSSVRWTWDAFTGIVVR